MDTNYKVEIEIQINGAYQPVIIDKVYPTIQKAKSALYGQLRKYDRQEICARAKVVTI